MLMLKCLNTIKKSTAPKQIHKFNAIPVRIATESDKLVLRVTGWGGDQLEEQQKH